MKKNQTVSFLHFLYPTGYKKKLNLEKACFNAKIYTNLHSDPFSFLKLAPLSFIRFITKI